jgi:protein-S-isoprenylcysteine O-methyltransferase Ste14
MRDQFLYALAWLLFGLVHSGLAALRVKALLAPRLGRWRRLAYNGIALASFAAVAAVGAATLGRWPDFGLPAWLLAAMAAVHVAGWVVLVAAARFYDLGRLAGTAQLKGASEDEGLRRDGPHAWVRHPLYTGAYLILWGAAATPLGLATALWGSLYLAVGTALEERKLLLLYGESYRDYRRRVPALLPWRGRVL